MSILMSIIKTDILIVDELDIVVGFSKDTLSNDDVQHIKGILKPRMIPEANKNKYMLFFKKDLTFKRRLDTK